MTRAARPGSARRLARLAATVWALAVAAIAVAGAGAAYAAPDAEVGIADDRILLQHPARAPGAVAMWKALGIDVVRIHARWIGIAPGAHSLRRPKGFRPRDPSDPKYNWGRLDNAVRLVRSRGMAVMLQITGSGPLWSSAAPSRRNPRWKPEPKAFAHFAEAVAVRYGPLVDRYIVWNEPNQPGWLEPQWRCRRGRCTPVAPHLYRSLVRAAAPAIRAADPGARILIGALAPRGKRGTRSRTPMRPLEFLRAMGCVNRDFSAVRTGRCANFRAAGGDGFAYHPHGVLNAPNVKDPQRDNARIADLPRLETVLDRLTARGRLRASTGRFDLYLTEFGYQTFPPDVYQGVMPETQTKWLAHAAYIAWHDQRVRGLIQYEWRDEPLTAAERGRRAYGGWQSGLLYSDGAPKPALFAFAHPFYAHVPSGRRTAIMWGQVRPGGAHWVTLLRRAAGEREFRPMMAIPTNANGYWMRRIRLSSTAYYRFSYELPRGPSAPPIRLLSAVARVGPR